MQPARDISVVVSEPRYYLTDSDAAWGIWFSMSSSVHDRIFLGYRLYYYYRLLSIVCHRFHDAQSSLLSISNLEIVTSEITYSGTTKPDCRVTGTLVVLMNVL
jgi:hypothetical protein